MTWDVGLFYYEGSKKTPTAQISNFVQEFDGVLLLTNNEGVSYNLSTLVNRINDFWNAQSGFQILVEIPNPSGAKTYSYMKARLDEIEAQAGAKVRGYYLLPEGSYSMYNATATDSSNCRDNIRDIVADVKALNKYALWVPVEGAMSFNWMDQCQSHISFTNITPQLHYYQVANASGDSFRPKGMTYNDLKSFMQNCKSRGWGVEFECDDAVNGTSENCGCGTSAACTKRSANYYCASDEVGGFTYIYHYMGNDIGNYNTVKNYHNANFCPTGGYTTC
ncbi:MAG: hypothetical protein ACXQS3_00755 [Candidatus Methanofastidiosia archaeon]